MRSPLARMQAIVELIRAAAKAGAIFAAARSEAHALDALVNPLLLLSGWEPLMCRMEGYRLKLFAARMVVEDC